MKGTEPFKYIYEGEALTIKQIADRIGQSKAFVRLRLNKSEIKSGEPVSAAVFELARPNLYLYNNQHLSVAEIAKAIGEPRSFVCAVVIRHKFKPGDIITRQHLARTKLIKYLYREKMEDFKFTVGQISRKSGVSIGVIKSYIKSIKARPLCIISKQSLIQHAVNLRRLHKKRRYDCGGGEMLSITEIGEKLNISRATVYARMRKMELIKANAIDLGSIINYKRGGK